MILLIDNYDSFTFNLVQRLGAIVPDMPVAGTGREHATSEGGG